MEVLEHVQRRMIKGLERLSYEDRLIVQPGEEKALGRLYRGLPVNKEGLQENWGGTLCQGV